MVGGFSFRRQEKFQYPQQDPKKQGSKPKSRDEEVYDYDDSRSQLEAPTPSQRHPPGQPPSLPPPSRLSDGPAGRDYGYGVGGRSDRLDGRQQEYGVQPAHHSNVHPESSHQKLKQNIKRLQEDNEILEEEIQKLNTECGRLKNRVEIMQSTQDVQESRLGRQEQDESIRQQFNNIFQPIKKWSTNFCTDAS